MASSAGFCNAQANIVCSQKQRRPVMSSMVSECHLCQPCVLLWPTGAMLASQAEASAFTDKHGHKLLNGGHETKRRN